MPKPAAELARAWLLKAFSDLDTARQIGGLPDGHLDAGIYHCQQAALKKGMEEKSREFTEKGSELYAKA